MLIVIAVCAVCIAGILIEKGFFSEDNIPAFSELTDGSGKVNFTDDTDFDFGVYYIDVGQGDSELIRSGSTTVLIDAGEKEYGKTVCSFIKSLGIEKLDYVIASHPHADHIGGMAEVIKEFDIGRIIVPRVSDELIPTSTVYENFLDAVREKSMKLTPAKQGTVYQLDGSELEILAPVSDDYSDLNDFSVVCRITDGNNSFLFTGDASKPAENDIIDSGEDISADVLKVGHHGSSTSSGKNFLEAVQPAVCVISCGTGNSYGHPNEEAMNRLKAFTDKIYRTDLDGTVVIYSDGDQLYIKTEKQRN